MTSHSLMTVHSVVTSLLDDVTFLDDVTLLDDVTHTLLDDVTFLHGVTPQRALTSESAIGSIGGTGRMNSGSKLANDKERTPPPSLRHISSSVSG